ncbi:MAG: cupin domain-containing protein [Gemmatimonadetes bacterium]|nr:cupin domain-containing protein [Gemmatimonadota bacterium]
MAFEIVRLFADADGESHFTTTTVELASIDFAPPAPPLEVSEMVDARHGFLRAPPGWFGDWHPTPARQFMCLLRGVLEVAVSDGEVRRMTPGMVVLLEDLEGRGHSTRVVSDEPALLVFAQIPGKEIEE